MVTETAALTAALDAAATTWPGVPRSELLARLALAGADAHRHAELDAQANRRAAVARLAGSMTGRFGQTYLDDLRQEWPP